MSNKYKLGVSFLLLMLITFIGSPMIFANVITINNQSCVDSGGTVVFTFSLNNAPKPLKGDLHGSIGMKISFDNTILEYSSFTAGEVLAKFGMVQANPVPATNPNTLRVAGIDINGTGGFPEGESGKICEVTFKVLKCEPSAISVKLDDEMAVWPVQNGGLTPPHAPVLQPIGAQKVYVGDTLSFTVQATDEDGDAITYAISDVPPDGVSLDGQTGQFTWTPAQDQANQTYSLVIKATDTTDRSDEETVSITVQAPSDPVLQPIGNKTVSAGDTLSFTAVATDADGDVVTYEASGTPAGATFDGQTGQFNWVPTQDHVGQPYSVVITATDSTGRSTSETVAITVTSATLSLNNQSCGAAGDEVTFTISVNGAPNDVEFFGLKVNYDENILEFKPSTDGSDRGDLTHDFDFFGVSHFGVNTLMVGGSGRAGFAQGSSGSFANLVFVVKSCEPTTVSIIRDTLDDHLAGWSVADGLLTEGPSILCPSPIVVEADSLGGASASNPQIDGFLNGATAADAMNNPLSVTPTAPALFVPGDNEVTFTTTDSNEITASCKSTVTVQDTIGPAISCPAVITVEATGPDGIPASAVSDLNNAVAADVVDGPLNANVSAPAVFPLGSTDITFSAQDSRGNVSNCPATVTVVDSTPPSITCPSIALQLEAEGPSGVPADRPAIVAFFEEITATDTVDSSVAITHDAPAQFGIGTNTVTFTAQDDYANKDTCVATVIVGDSTAPLINCPGDITIEANTSAGVDISDTQIQDFLNGVTASDGISEVSINHNAPAQFGLGSREVIFTAQDVYGNSDTCTAMVNVVLVDITPPEINCPQDITVAADGIDGVSASSNAQIQEFLKAASVTDDIDDIVEVSTDAPAIFPLGSTIVTFAAVDSALNSDSCQATVLVEDQTPPSITCPENITVETENAAGVPATNAQIAAFLAGVTATDGIDGSEVAFANTAPTQFAVGETVVTFTATDKSGNSRSCMATVTVKKITPQQQPIGGLYGSTIFGGWSGGWSGSSVPYYQPSVDLYQSYNNTLYNFQQSWDLQSSSWNTGWNNYNQQWFMPTSSIWNQQWPSWY